MLFNSLTFLIFFPLCVAIFFIVPKKLRKYWLLVTSLCFYMCWNVAYVALLVLSIVVTYVAGILIGKAGDNIKYKKLAVTGSLIINFGILFIFKYYNFFGLTINKIHKFGHGIPALSLLLPVGISFYIFQAVGYTIDVYRGAAPEKNIVKYALFVSFFPQLVAGPIERSGNLLKQINELDRRNFFGIENLVKGAATMLYGYFMKLMIADRSALLVNTVFDNELYSTFTGFQVIIAAILFSIQIYCDFAGYTYIAIGAARVMGFMLCDNFNAPYLSTTIKEFWDRWHISLSTWFRDYLYFPLGGSRHGIIRKYINIFIVFAVSGLWHGASWHFVVWGVLHGILRIIGEITAPFRVKMWARIGYDTETASHRFIKGAVNFLVVTICWVFFRAESTRQATDLIKAGFTGGGLWQFTDESLLNIGLDAKEWNVLLFSILIMVLVDIMKNRKKDPVDILYRQNDWAKFAFFFIAIIAIVIFGIYGAEYDASAFIYFQF